MSDEPIAKIQVVLTDTKKKPNLFDPSFKQVIKKQAQEVGIEVAESSIQHNTLADTVLRVPPGISVTETLFDFFRRVNVLEFKGPSDNSLTMREFIKNQTRTNIIYLNEPDTDYRDYLTVYVVARHPQEFLKEARAEGLRFKAVKDKPWLLEAKNGVQPVVLVLGRKLPVETPYLYWLVFASMDKDKWFNYMIEVVRHKDPELIRLIRRLRRKEYDAIMSNVAFIEQLEKEGLISPEERDYFMGEELKEIVADMSRMKKKSPQEFREAVKQLTPEFRELLVQTPELTASLIQVPELQELIVQTPELKTLVVQNLEPQDLANILTEEQLQQLIEVAQKKKQS
jgi:hypothetical protein